MAKEDEKEGAGGAFWILGIFAVSGFASMAYEVIWIRLLGLIIGPTTYSFTLVVTAFIMGIALVWIGSKSGNWQQYYTKWTQVYWNTMHPDTQVSS